MDCPLRARDGEAVLLDYCARKLDAERMAELERHCGECEPCRAWLASQQAVWSALDSWTPPPVSPDFDRRLHARLDGEPRRWWQWNVGRLKPALSLAAASAVVLAVLLTRPPRPAAPPPHSQLEQLDIDHLERTLEDVEMLHQLATAPPEDSQEM